MKKACFPIINLLAGTLLCVDFLYKYQAYGISGSFSTIAIVVFLGAVVKIMVEINLSNIKKGKIMIFRPPFLKAEYLEDYEKFQYKRYGVYLLFGGIVGLMFYLTRSTFSATLQEMVEILAIAFMFCALAWGMFESFVKRYIKLRDEALERGIKKANSK